MPRKKKEVEGSNVTSDQSAQTQPDGMEIRVPRAFKITATQKIIPKSVMSIGFECEMSLEDAQELKSWQTSHLPIEVAFTCPTTSMLPAEQPKDEADDEALG